MKEFAYIHQNTPHGQILVTKEFDVDDDSHKVTIAFLHDGLRIDASIKNLDDDDAQEVFTGLQNRQRVLSLISEVTPF